MLLRRLILSGVVFIQLLSTLVAAGGDLWRDLQTSAVQNGRAAFGHWGPDPDRYSSWTSHSNRLIPIYTFGMDLDSIHGERSVYRDAERLKALYGELPSETLNPSAEYFDQTDVYHLQKRAVESGKKYIVLLVFDGMDWQLTQLAAIAKSRSYAQAGRGSGLHFLDYKQTVTDYGLIVTAPHNSGTECDVDRQQVLNPGGTLRGGYNFQIAGTAPWCTPTDPLYLIGESTTYAHAYTDSSSSATSLTAGIKTYNGAVNVDPFGRQVDTIAHQLQSMGFAVGIVSSVPISHATPASAYAHNVLRSDYQDLTRDMIGLPSIAHPAEPLAGLDVVVGAGWGDEAMEDKAQGANFMPGNLYLTSEDLNRIHCDHGGKYVTVVRQPNTSGQVALRQAADRAISSGHRLFGMFGYKTGHLPFRTANGDFQPTIGIDSEGQPVAPEQYSAADLTENPTLSEMATTALDVLASRSERFWLMVESGDVDWAAHQNNIDSAAGAVISGDDAFRAVTQWIEQRDAWDQSVVIVTSDHGHYFVFDDPQVLIEASPADGGH